MKTAKHRNKQEEYLKAQVIFTTALEQCKGMSYGAMLRDLTSVSASTAFTLGADNWR